MHKLMFGFFSETMKDTAFIFGTVQEPHKTLKMYERQWPLNNKSGVKVT